MFALYPPFERPAVTCPPTSYHVRRMFRWVQTLSNPGIQTGSINHTGQLNARVKYKPSFYEPEYSQAMDHSSSKSLGFFETPI